MQPPPAGTPPWVTGPPPGPDRRRRAFAVAVAVLSLILVGLITAIVVVLARDRSRGDHTASGDTQTSGTRTSDVDRCVVGRWRVTGHREDVDLPEIGTVRFTGGQGALVTIEADGAGRTDYGDGIAYTGKAGTTGQAGAAVIRLEFRGAFTYRFTAIEGRSAKKPINSTVTARLFRDGDLVSGPTPIEGSSDPASYTCAGDVMIQTTARYQTTLRRQR